jgi:hypothetical protein
VLSLKEIQQHVLNGEIGEAIQCTYKLFPGILEKNPNLLFSLKTRQFIEMINDLDKEAVSKRSINSQSDKKKPPKSSHQHKQPGRHSSPSGHNLQNTRSLSPASRHLNGNSCLKDEIVTNSFPEAASHNSDALCMDIGSFNP